MAKKTKPQSQGTAAKSAANGVLEKIKSVYDFMIQHNLETLELDEPGRHVRLVRRRAQTTVPVPVPVAAAAAPGAMAAPAPPAATSAPAALPPGAVTLKANMMGIFYRASTPSSPPYAKEGDKISAGQVIGMIEAMKVFNEVKADFPCTLLKALVENGKPVKLGQDIFLIKRD